jgi:hypothetical protein
MARLSERKENSSALSRRTLEQIAKDQDAVWHSNRNGHQEAPERNQPILDSESLPKARVGFMEPMLADRYPSCRQTIESGSMKLN